MHLGILQAGHSADPVREKHGDYNDMFCELLKDQGFSFTTYQVLHHEFPVNARSADGWIITGSRHGVYEDHSWIKPLEDLIREIYAQNIPMVGICFGHQIMAQAMNGQVKKVGWVVGPTEYKHHDKSISSNLIAWHQDQVVAMPDNATITMSSASCPIAGLQYKKNAISFQPHPEFSHSCFKDMIEARKSILPGEVITRALEQDGSDLNRDTIAQLMADFFTR